MPKVLYLLRHAKSSWKDMSLKDFDRPLNKRGKHDAPFMAEKMSHMGIHPEIIISSPAKRAKKTAKIFATTLNTELQLEESLYAAGIDTMTGLIQKAFEKYDEVMIVGHNPELTLLNDLLSDKEIFNIPTTGIVAISFPDNTLKNGKQLFYYFPKAFGESQ